MANPKFTNKDILNGQFCFFFPMNTPGNGIFDFIGVNGYLIK